MYLKIIIVLLLYSVLHISYAFSQNLIFDENDNIFFETNQQLDKGSFNNSYYFLSPYNSEEQYLTIFDQFGTPVFIKELNSTNHNFQLQRNGYISFYNSKTDNFNLVDSSYNLIGTYDVTSDYTLDWHEFLITENNHAFLIGKDFKVVGIDTIIDGFTSGTTLVGCVIQEFDEQNNVTFEWKSWDYFKISDSYIDLGSQIIDYVHPNSIEIDYDGHILLSSRNLSEITKIDKNTGEIIWRLGGKNNEFNFLNDEGFSFQHSIKRLSNGYLTIFDNGNLKDNKESRGVVYEIDDKNKIIKKIKEFRSKKSVFSIWMGNMQNLPNGNKIIGWGKNDSGSVFSEFDSDGNEILKVSTDDKYMTYRAFRFPWKTNLFKSDVENIDFGQVDSDSDTLSYITITNNSNYPINISGYSTLDTIFTIPSGFPIKLLPYKDIVLPVKFAPNNTDGEINDILTIHSDSIFNTGLWRRVAIQVYLTGFIKDKTPPNMSIYPRQNQSDVPVDTSIIIKFDEPVRKLNNEEFNSYNLNKIITLEKVSENLEIPILSSINDDSNKITVKPDIDLEYGERYSLYIDAMIEDYNDNAINDTIIYFSTSLSTSIDNEMRGYNVYPNPTSGKFTVKSNNQIIKIELYNQSGVFKKAVLNNYYSDDMQFDISELPSGIYFLKIYLEDNKIMQYKVLKN